MIKLDEKLVGPNTENESEFFKGLEEIGDKIYQAYTSWCVVFFHFYIYFSQT